jgi:hypothetical protein
MYAGMVFRQKFDVFEGFDVFEEEFERQRSQRGILSDTKIIKSLLSALCGEIQEFFHPIKKNT